MIATMEQLVRACQTAADPAERQALVSAATAALRQAVGHASPPPILYDAACLALYHRALRWFDAQLLDAEGQRIPAFQRDQALHLHLFNVTYGHGLVVWALVQRGDVDATQQACKAWCVAWRDALHRAIAAQEAADREETAA